MAPMVNWFYTIARIKHGAKPGYAGGYLNKYLFVNFYVYVMLIV